LTFLSLLNGQLKNFLPLFLRSGRHGDERYNMY
jgi:hypothetical protein